MGLIYVHGIDLEGDRVQQLRVVIPNVPPRTIDRPTAIAWMTDGHSLVPLLDGEPLPALQLVAIEEGDEVKRFLRDDHDQIQADSAPPLPPVAEAGI